MATNSLPSLPSEVESDFPHAPVWTGLRDLLVNKRAEKVMSVSRFFGKLARSLKHLLWIPSHHRAVRSPRHVGKTHEGALVKASAKPSLQVTPAQVTQEWRCLQMTPAPAIWVFQVEAPDTVEQRQDIPALPWGNCRPEGSVSIIRCLLFHPLSLRAG